MYTIAYGRTSVVKQRAYHAIDQQMRYQAGETTLAECFGSCLFGIAHSAAIQVAVENGGEITSAIVPGPS
jgi:hypothetical protein